MSLVSTSEECLPVDPSPDTLSNNDSESVVIDVKESPMFACSSCTFEAENEKELVEHVTTHKPMSCDDCDVVFDTEIALDCHIEETHLLSEVIQGQNFPKVTLYPCQSCDFHATSQHVLKDHMNTSHVNKKNLSKPSERHIGTREKQIETSTINSTINVSTETQTQGCYCTMCEYTTPNEDDLNIHYEQAHNAVSCEYCDFIYTDEQDFRQHVYERHTDIIKLNTMASQIDDMFGKLQGLTNFQTQCESLFQTIIDNQNTLKQEFFLLRNQKYISPTKDKKTEDVEPKTDTNKAHEKITPPLTVSPNVLSSQTLETHSLNKAEIKSKSKPFILHIGDTRGLIDKNVFEKKSEVKIKTKTINRDERGKSSSLLPEFISKKGDELKPDCVIFQTGASAVLRPSDPNSIEAEYFKQEVIVSANNIYNAASRALNNPSTKAVIMKLPIRKKDPSFKKSLSNLFNNTLIDLHKESRFREKIAVIEDKYFRNEVTADLAKLITTMFPCKSSEKVNVTSNSHKEDNSNWQTVKEGKSLPHRTKTTTPFTIPTNNRFRPLGN